MIITAEYQDGAIKLWPPPDPMEGKRIAQEILDRSPIEELETEVDRFRENAEQAESDLQDLQGEFNSLQDDLENMEDMDFEEMKTALKNIMQRYF